MSEKLLEALQNAALYDHPVQEFQVIQTHISWVLLTGEFAYKIKKPVDFGFLNFTALDRRLHYCQEELRLNQRLAPELYLDVVAIHGTEEQPSLSGSGEPLEYALKMKQFPQDGLLSTLEAQGQLQTEHIDVLATLLARFHADIPCVEESSPLGTANAVVEPMRQNFVQIRAMLTDAGDLAQLEQLEGWAESTAERLHELLNQRRANGHVRECHGDAHLGNIALLDGKPLLFDCIEFNEEFKWIDTASDFAFLAMDLQHRGHPQLAARLVNRYLEESGDYESARVLDFYRAYRAMVRGKIALFQMSVPGQSDAQVAALLQTYRSYADLAETYTEIPQPYLLVMHGVSGTGKSTASAAIVEQLSAIRIRSDAERKRLHGLARNESSHSGIQGGIYTQEASARVYEYMLQTSETLLRAGQPVVVDAAFLKRSQRDLFHALAERMAVAHLIIHCNTSEQFAREWIQQRQQAGEDVSEAGTEVLEAQLASQEPLEENELSYTWEVAPTRPESIDQLIARIRHVLIQYHGD